MFVAVYPVVNFLCGILFGGITTYTIHCSQWSLQSKLLSNREATTL